MMVIKLDADGDVLWSTVFSEAMQGQGVEESHDQKYIYFCA